MLELKSMVEHISMDEYIHVVLFAMGSGNHICSHKQQLRSLDVITCIIHCENLLNKNFCEKYFH